MKYKKYYTDKEIKIDELFVLDGEEFLHMVQVMRTRIGETVSIFNGDGFDYIGKVVEIQKKAAVIEIKEKVENNINPKANVTLFQALVKGDKLSTIVQKNTELGTKEIVLFESEFSDVKVGAKNLDKQKRVVVSACKQCGSSELLIVEKEVKFKEMIKMLGNYDKVIFAYECEESNNIGDVLKTLSSTSKIAVIVGAEGGFSVAEANEIVQAGGISTRLGKRILRAETAGIVLPGMIILSLEK